MITEITFQYQGFQLCYIANNGIIIIIPIWGPLNVRIIKTWGKGE